MSWEIYTVHFDYATLPCKFDYREQNVMGHVRLVFWFFPPSEGKSVAKLAKSGQIWAHKSHFWISSQNVMGTFTIEKLTMSSVLF